MYNLDTFKPLHSAATVDRTHPFAWGLVGAWVFNEYGSKVIMNRANTNLAGKATMQTAPSWVGTQWGAGLKFVPSASDYALIPTFPGFRPTTYPYSIAARAKVSEVANGGVIWTNDDTADKYSGITLGCTGAGLWWLRIGDGGGVTSADRTDMYAATSPGANTWASVVFNVYSLSSYACYVNGLSNTGSITGTGAAITYGTSGNGALGREDISSLAAHYYSDHISDYIYFWTGRTLSESEIFQLHVSPYIMFGTPSRAKFFVTAPTGWGHKINSVSGASISKINGVTRSSISKVNSVA